MSRSASVSWRYGSGPFASSRSLPAEHPRQCSEVVSARMQKGMLRLVDPEAMLINFERADLRFERRSRDPESRRRTYRTGYAAFARGERRLDSRSLVGCQFVIPWGRESLANLTSDSH